MPGKILLAIETTTSNGSLAIFNDGLFVADICWEKGRSHSDVITTQFSKLLQKLSLDIKSINELAVDIGPGSFTGNRIGLNFAASLAYSLDIKIVGINSLEILAYQAKNQQLPIVCMQNAFNNRVYIAEFNIKSGQLEPSSPPRVAEPSRIDITKESLCLGSGLETYKDQLLDKTSSLLVTNPGFSTYPEAKYLGEISVTSKYKPLEWESVKPLYIKGSEAEEKLMRGELKKTTSGLFLKGE